MRETEPREGVYGVAAEPDEVSAKVVVGFAVILTLATAIAGALVAALFWHFNRTAQRSDERIVSEAGLQRQQSEVPPLPRLQVFPVRHWRDFQTAERERLDSYGWMDRSTGAVHIPIDHAIDLIAERGVAPLPPAPIIAPAAPLPPSQPEPEKKQ